MARFDNGWVKFHRKMMAGDIAQNPNCFLVWSWLLTNANYLESKAMFQGKQIVMRPGMVICGLSEIARHWGISNNTVKKWLCYLESTARIALDICTHGCLVTIINWELYQGNDDEACTTSAQNLQTGCKRTANELQLNEERKKERINTGAQKTSRVEGVNEFIAKYCEGIKRKYGDNPPITGKDQGIAKGLVKDLGLPKALLILETYLKNPDRRFWERKHDLATLKLNLNSIAIKPRVVAPPPVYPTPVVTPEPERTLKPEELSNLIRRTIKPVPSDEGPGAA